VSSQFIEAFLGDAKMQRRDENSLRYFFVRRIYAFPITISKRRSGRKGRS